MLIAKWQGTVILPPLPVRRVRVGGNQVTQHLFLGAECKAQIFDSEINGHDFIRTNLDPPYNELLLRHKGAKRRDGETPVVTGPDSKDHESWPKTFDAKWDALGVLEDFADRPDKVLTAWTNQFTFREASESEGITGLRRPQIGALHAIAAHFAVGTEFEPAMVVLPTGTGKTETMLAAEVYGRLPRTLVLVPSETLRKQISAKFQTLGILPQAGIVKKEIARPRVAIIETGIRSAEDAELLLEHANVIVALPNVLSASDPAAVNALVDGCTDLIIDEAHHVPAKTWSEIRERFAAKRILQFTATPFRRDKERIDGKIIFNYKLGDAQDADYYRPIKLITVEEYGDEQARDRAIAVAALDALRRDRNELNLDHLLMARTRKRERAEAVAAIYRELAPEFRTQVVYSGTGRAKANDEALAAILDRGPDGSRIIVCVDMLGEGFDLPNLKIAALHDSHKSIAITLQFIGRFTRKGDWEKVGEATVIANVADETTETKLADLYAQGADWDKVIRRLSEETIETEQRLQDVVYGLKAAGDLGKQLSLWNLRPPFSAQFFRTSCTDWSPLQYKEVLPASAESWFAYDEDRRVFVAVVSRAANVKWGNYENVLNTIYDLIILRWDQTAGVLCVYASDYNAMRSERLAELVTDENTRLVSGTPIFRILNNVELPLAKSVGSSRIGAISFTSYFGPNVTEGLANIEKATSELNNIACLGYEDGNRVLWGGTQRRGKIWQVKKGSISEWIDWTSATWEKVTSEGSDEANITAGFLRPERMAGPHSSHPIAAQWGEQAQMRTNENQGIIFGDTEVPLFMVDLEISDVGDDGSICFRLSADDANSEYRLTISESVPAGYKHQHVSGPTARFRKARNEAVDLEEYLKKDPFIVRYADGSYSYNCYHIATNISGGTFDKGRLENWDWTGIPLNKESMGKAGDANTIQYRTFEHLADEFDLIFNDDGKGEAADLICLKDLGDSTIRLCLVHCKGAHGGHVSQDIRNFYVVCGQAQKNVTAKHMGMPRLYHDLRRRQETWVQQGANRFLKGDMRLLALFRDKARRSKIDFEVILVQPGASITTVTDDSLRLLATTELYLAKTTEASFRVVLSA